MTDSTPTGRDRATAIVNAIVVVGVVAWNYWTAANGIDGRTVGGMSDRYDTLFTPAAYAFSIWGIIFLGLVVNAVYLLREVFGATAHETTRAIGPFLILTNLANGLWIYLWLSERTALSVVTLFAMFVLLGVVMLRLRMEVWDAPRGVIVSVWWPIVIYAGWVTVAVLANLSAYLAKEELVSGDSVPWAVAMVVVATVYNLVLVATRNLREHAVVAMWAFVAIAVARADTEPVVQWTAIGATLVLGVAVAAHAYINRSTLPFTPGSTR